MIWHDRERAMFVLTVGSTFRIASEKPLVTLSSTRLISGETVPAGNCHLRFFGGHFCWFTSGIFRMSRRWSDSAISSWGGLRLQSHSDDRKKKTVSHFHIVSCSCLSCSRMCFFTSMTWSRRWHVLREFVYLFNLPFMRERPAEHIIRLNGRMTMQHWGHYPKCPSSCMRRRCHAGSFQFQRRLLQVGATMLLLSIWLPTCSDPKCSKCWIHTHVCMYIYIYIHVCVCMYNIHVYTWVYIYIHRQNLAILLNGDIINNSHALSTSLFPEAVLGKSPWPRWRRRLSEKIQWWSRWDPERLQNDGCYMLIMWVKH